MLPRPYVDVLLLTHITSRLNLVEIGYLSGPENSPMWHVPSGPVPIEEATHFAVITLPQLP